MAVLNASEIADLVITTLEDLGRMRFQQIAQPLQEYEVMSHFLKKDRVQIDDGYGIKRTLMLNYGSAARRTGLFGTDDVNVYDHLAQLSVPWRQVTTNWAFEKREMLMNRGKSLLNKIILPRRAGAMIALAEILEADVWKTLGATDDEAPFGIPYYIVKDTTTGFNGGHAAGHSSTAGIDVGTYPNYKNYTVTYDTGTAGDEFTTTNTLKPLRTMHRKLGWRSPVSTPDLGGTTTMNRYRLYVNEAVITGMEGLGEAQNENLGRDLARYGGDRDIAQDTLLFRRHPIVWIPKLDDDSQNPVYMMDLSTWNPVVLRGDFLRESAPKEAPNQHNTMVVHVDLSYNYVCVDRRRNGILYDNTL